jgi:hypothetical protein
MRKLLRKASAVIQQLLIAIDPWDELPEGMNYNVIVLGTIRANDYQDASKIRTAEETLLHLEQIVSAVGGIDIQVRVRSETDISLHDARSFQPWDFESLTFSENQPAPVERNLQNPPAN